MKDYGNCSYCDFTYDPCPIHEPEEHAMHQLEVGRRLAERDAALQELEERWVELPPWVQVALRAATPMGLKVPT